MSRFRSNIEQKWDDDHLISTKTGPTQPSILPIMAAKKHRPTTLEVEEKEPPQANAVPTLSPGENIDAITHLTPISPSTHFQLYLYIKNWQLENVCEFLAEFSGQCDLNLPFPTSLFRNPSIQHGTMLSCPSSAAETTTTTTTTTATTTSTTTTTTTPLVQAASSTLPTTDFLDGTPIQPTEITYSTITPLLAAISLKPATPEQYQLQLDLCHVLILWGADLYYTHSPSQYSIRSNPPLADYTPAAARSYGKIYSPLIECILQSKFTLLYHFITQYGLILPPLPLSTLLLDPTKSVKQELNHSDSSSFIHHSLFHLLIEHFIRLGIDHGLEHSLTLQCFALIQTWLSLTTAPQTATMNVFPSTFLMNRATLNPPNYLDENPLHLDLTASHNNVGYINTTFSPDRDGTRTMNNIFDEEFKMSPSLQQKVRTFLFERIQIRLSQHRREMEQLSEEDESNSADIASTTKKMTAKEAKARKKNSKSSNAKPQSLFPSYIVTNPNLENEDENIAESREPTMDYFSKLLEINMNAFGDLPPLPPRPTIHNLRSYQSQNQELMATSPGIEPSSGHDEGKLAANKNEKKLSKGKVSHPISNPSSTTDQVTKVTTNNAPPSKSPAFIHLMNDYCQEVTEKDKKLIRAAFDEVFPLHHNPFHADLLASIISGIPISELYSLTVEAGQHLEILSQRAGGIPGALKKNPKFNRKQAQLIKQKIRAVKQQRKKKKGTFRKTVFTRRLDANGDPLDEYQCYSDDSDDEPFFAPSNRRGGIPTSSTSSLQPGFDDGNRKLRTSARLRSNALDVEWFGSRAPNIDSHNVIGPVDGDVHNTMSFDLDPNSQLPARSSGSDFTDGEDNHDDSSSTSYSSVSYPLTPLTQDDQHAPSPIPTTSTDFNPFCAPPKPNTLSSIDTLLSTKVSIRSVVMMLFSIDLAILSMLHKPIFNNETHPFFFFTQQSSCPDSRQSLFVSGQKKEDWSHQDQELDELNDAEVISKTAASETEASENEPHDHSARVRNSSGRFSKTKPPPKRTTKSSQLSEITTAPMKRKISATSATLSSSRSLPILTRPKNTSTPILPNQPSIQDNLSHNTQQPSPATTIMKNTFVSMALQALPMNPIYQFTCFAVHYLDLKRVGGTSFSSYSPHTMTPLQNKHFLFGYLLSQSITPVPHLIEKSIFKPSTPAPNINGNTTYAPKSHNLLSSKKIVAPSGNHSYDSERGYVHITFSSTQSYLITKQDHFISFLLHTSPFISQIEFDKAIRSYCGIPLHYNPAEFSLDEYYASVTSSTPLPDPASTTASHSMNDNQSYSVSTPQLFKLHRLFFPNSFPTSGSVFVQLLAMRRYDLFQYVLQKWAPFLLEIYHSPRGRLNVINSLIYSNYKSSPMTRPLFNMVTNQKSLSDLMETVESWYNTYYFPSIGKPLTHPFIDAHVNNAMGTTGDSFLGSRNGKMNDNQGIDPQCDDETPLLFIPNGIMINMSALRANSSLSAQEAQPELMRIDSVNDRALYSEAMKSYQPLTTATNSSIPAAVDSTYLETIPIEPLNAAISFNSSSFNRYLNVPTHNLYKSHSNEHYGVDRNQLGLSDAQWMKMEHSLMKTASSQVISSNDLSSFNHQPQKQQQGCDHMMLINDLIVPIEFLVVNAFIHHEVNYPLLISLLTTCLNAREQTLVSLSSPNLHQKSSLPQEPGASTVLASQPAATNEDAARVELFDIVHWHILQQQYCDLEQHQQYQQCQSTSNQPGICDKLPTITTPLSTPRILNLKNALSTVFSPPPTIFANANQPPMKKLQALETSTLTPRLAVLTPYPNTPSTPRNFINNHHHHNNRNSFGVNTRDDEKNDFPMISIADLDTFQTRGSQSGSSRVQDNFVLGMDPVQARNPPSLFHSTTPQSTRGSNNGATTNPYVTNKNVLPRLQHTANPKSEALFHSNDYNPLGTCGDEADIDEGESNHFADNLTGHSPVAPKTRFLTQNPPTSAPQLQQFTPSCFQTSSALEAIYETASSSPDDLSMPMIENQDSVESLNSVMEHPYSTTTAVDANGNENFTASILQAGGLGTDELSSHIHVTTNQQISHPYNDPQSGLQTHQHAPGSIQRPLDFLSSSSDTESNLAQSGPQCGNHPLPDSTSAALRSCNNKSAIFPIRDTPSQLPTLYSTQTRSSRHLQPQSIQQIPNLFPHHDPSQQQLPIQYIQPPMAQNDSMPEHNNPDLSWAARQLPTLEDEMISILASDQLIPTSSTTIQPSEISNLINLDQIPSTTFVNFPMQHSLNLIIFAYCRGCSHLTALLTKLFKLHLQIKHHNLKMALYYSIRNYFHFLSYPTHPGNSPFDFSFESIIDFYKEQEQVAIEAQQRFRKMQRQHNQLNDKTKKENQLKNNKANSGSSRTTGRQGSLSTPKSRFLRCIGSHNFNLLISTAFGLYQKYETSGNCIIQHNPDDPDYFDQSKITQSNSLSLTQLYPQPMLKTLPLKLFPTAAMTPAFSATTVDSSHREMIQRQLIGSFDTVLGDIITDQPICERLLSSFEQQYFHRVGEDKDLFDQQSFLEEEMANRSTVLIINCPYSIPISAQIQKGKSNLPFVGLIDFVQPSSIDTICDRFTQLANRYFANSMINHTRFKLLQGMIMAGISSFLNRHNPQFQPPSIKPSFSLNDNDSTGSDWNIGNTIASGVAPSIEFITILNKLHHVLTPNRCALHPDLGFNSMLPPLTDQTQPVENELDSQLSDSSSKSASHPDSVHSVHPSVHKLIAKFAPNFTDSTSPIPLPFHYTNLPSLLPLDPDSRLVVPLLSPSMPTDLVMLLVNVMNAICSEDPLAND